MSRAIAALARSTPPDRDRVVDAVRALAITVVVLWHWVGSLTHRGPDGVVVMPNPIDAVPGGWLATWVLQIVPLFFVVGGYANLAGWDASGGRARVFWRRRARRLLAPVGLWLGLWLALETAGFLLVDGHRPLWAWFPGVLVPLWFVLVYGAVTAAVPLTARAHRAGGARVIAGLFVALAVSEVLSRGTGAVAAAGVSAALVWVLVHQLGYVWRDRGAHRGTGVVFAATGLAGLVVLTTLAGYPRTMVATAGSASNLLPTNATVAALAVLQIGLVWVVSSAAARLLERARVWRPVVALNAVALTVFVWHMTAFAVVLLGAEVIGMAPGSVPTAEWVLARPLWVIAPGAVLLAVVMAAGRVEAGGRTRREATGARSP